MTKAPDASRGLWARCTACGHAWIAALFPAVVLDIARITRGAVCPKCGDRHPVVAEQRDGVLLERVD